MSDPRLTRVEERLAEALKTIDDLSDEIARQSKVIDKLESRVAMLLQREALREAEGSGGVIVGDEKPPHY